MNQDIGGNEIEKHITTELSDNPKRNYVTMPNDIQPPSNPPVSGGLPVKTLWERINQLAEACDLYEKALKTQCTCETAVGCDYCDNIEKARELSS